MRALLVKDATRCPETVAGSHKLLKESFALLLNFLPSTHTLNSALSFLLSISLIPSHGQRLY